MHRVLWEHKRTNHRVIMSGKKPFKEKVTRPYLSGKYQLAKWTKGSQESVLGRENSVQKQQKERAT